VWIVVEAVVVEEASVAATSALADEELEVTVM